MAEAQETAAPKKHPVKQERRKPEPAQGQAQSPPAAVPAQAPAPQAPASAAPSAPPDFASRLKQGGAGTCANEINTLGAATMAGVAASDTVSHWATTKPEARPVSVFVGQRYPAGSPVPFGATGLIAAPNGSGSCDALSVQVVPSPLPCEKLKEALAAHGRQLGELSGIPLMEDQSGQTMLVPTAANTCVLVGVKAAYAK